MAESYEPKPGDRVRVVIEGRASSIDNNGVFRVSDLTPDSSYVIDPLDTTVVSVEKVEPLAEVFGPGDTVRYKLASDGYVYSIGHGGYFCHSTGVWKDDKEEVFTSKHFERVELR